MLRPLTLLLVVTMLRCATSFQLHSSGHSCKAMMIRRTFSSSSSADNNNKEVSPKKIHKVTWHTPESDDNIVFEALDGELLRTAALRRGYASPHNSRANLINCRGLGTCGTCAVALDGDWLPPLNSIESIRLSVPPGHGANNASRLRLACQIPVRGDVTVQKFSGFWGQFDQLVSPTVPTKPFGDVEYILDQTSPSSETEPRES